MAAQICNDAEPCRARLMAAQICNDAEPCRTEDKLRDKAEMCCSATTEESWRTEDELHGEAEMCCSTASEDGLDPRRCILPFVLHNVELQTGLKEGVASCGHGAGKGLGNAEVEDLGPTGGPPISQEYG